MSKGAACCCFLGFDAMLLTQPRGEQRRNSYLVKILCPKNGANLPLAPNLITPSRPPMDRTICHVFPAKWTPRVIIGVESFLFHVARAATLDSLDCIARCIESDSRSSSAVSEAILLEIDSKY